MKRPISVVGLLIALAMLANASPVHAQFSNLKIPKVGKHKADSSNSNTAAPSADSNSTAAPATPSSDSNTATAAPASGDAQSSSSDSNTAVIEKDSLQVTAYTINSYQKNFDTWSWVPRLRFRVKGPIPSGGQLSAEFTLPSGPWVKFDCKTDEVQKGKHLDVDAGAQDVPEDKGITATGPINFAIHLSNALAGTDSVLMSGKINVAKVHSNENPAKTANHFVYYADQDWNLSIAYLFYTPDSVSGFNLTTFNAAFWVRGDPTGFEPHLFYQGKEVGKIYFESNEMGKAGFKADISDEPSKTTDDSLPQKAVWARIVCSFPNVKGVDKTGKPPAPLANQKGTRHVIKDNPGDYEVKVLWKGKLARSIKFTVGPDGKLDNSISTANKLGDNKTIVPVSILGDQDGDWNHDAWKTDAFYGNPLTGFTPAP